MIELEMSILVRLGVLLCFDLQVQVIRGGNKKVLNKLIGAVQKETKGRADPVQVRKLLEELTL